MINVGMSGKKLLLFFIVFLLNFAINGNLYADRLKDRKLFIQAEQALLAGKRSTYLTLSKQLVNYPLYPYLLYNDIMLRIKQLPINELNQFFSHYDSIPVAQKLYTAWLTEVAHKRQWSTFIQFYNPNYRNSLKLQCLYAKAKWSVKDLTAAKTVTSKLWLTGKSLPKPCDEAIDKLKSAGYLTDELKWQRFQLALQENNKNLALYLLKTVPSHQQNLAKIMLLVHDSPSVLTHSTFTKHLSTLPIDILVHGLRRLGQKNPILSAHAWDTLYKDLPFSASQKELIINSIGLGFIKQNPTKAQHWLDKVNQNYLNSSLLVWQLRYLLAKQDWNKIQKKYEQLSTTKQEPVWHYWYARSLEQKYGKAKALPYYQKLANERNYYGFLAASHLKKSFPIQSKPLNYSSQDFEHLRNNPGIQRAYEFAQLNRIKQSNAEWWNAVEKMNSKQQYIAAKIAKTYGWSELALLTSAKTGYKNDLTLLYPTPFSSLVNGEALRNQLNPALVYAMMRQESYFRQTALSHAGARGLMQLMPATALDVASKLKHPITYIERLYDPATNILLGTAYLNYLFKKFNNHPILAIAAYNAGPNRIKKWLPSNQPWSTDMWVETIPINETRDYVKYVLTFAMIYEFQLGKKPNILPYLQLIPTKG